ncbi:helix-turn-helix domain-containing protein [Actinocatenispora thailandica]|uniref:helix-turn-helix domain-containing protein n=1 Tax=Actinocatenispora thailandica TaxID=227318 RepID=UPI00194DCDB0|nr:AraC family transcriptional regulator [Actinocatenispora thailandica]
MKTRQAIRRVPFQAPTPFGVEVMSIAELWAMAPPGYLAAPQRPTFHLLLLVTGGATTHTLDFEEHHLTRGCALWVRPGQVQVFGERAAGDLVLFESDFLIPGTHAAALADSHCGPVTVIAPFEPARRALRHEYDRARKPTLVAAETLRHLLSVLILELARAAPEPTPDRTGLDARFRALLERDFTTAHDVDHYARQLGYTTRTLNRATHTAVGESPKQAINRRLVLEARRLLAHTDQPITQLAHRLGFRDPSNFSAFFVTQTGQSPSVFRAGTRR